MVYQRTDPGDPEGSAIAGRIVDRKTGALVGEGKPFARRGTMIAAAAALPVSTEPLVALVGGSQQLSLDGFAL